MTKKKVLQVGPLPPPIGGISLYIKGLEKFESKNFRQEFFNVFPRNDKKLNKFFFNFFVLFKFMFILILYRPKIVHVHSAAYRSFYKNVAIVKISKLFCKSIIFHIHSGKFLEFYSTGNRRRKNLIKSTLNACDNIICLSYEWKRKFSESFTISSEKFDVLPNAIDYNEFQQVQQSELDQKKIILYIGSLNRNKGVLNIIKLAKLLKNNTNVKFIIAGKGPLEDEMKLQIKDDKLNVEMLGELQGEEKIHQFGRANFLILPSYFEAMGISIIEGMASGLVILASRVGGIPDVVHENEEGYLFNPGDVETYRDKIISITDDTIDRISKHNKEHAKKYDLTIFFNRLEEIYEGIG